MDIDKILQEMTFEEKAKLITFGVVLRTSGIERVDIPVITMSDGPHGIRNITDDKYIAEGDTCFPTGSALGSSWSKEIAYVTGKGLAEDCKKEHVDVLLGPGVNMKRIANCGRNFEYFSEDPYLSGMIAANLINGIQENGAGACVKHFAMNNQEINRGTINVEVDERTMREYYLKVFEIVLKYSNPMSVMCAYNKVNGIWCSENRYLLKEILRKEWNYNGLVMSDWGAVHDSVKAVKAGVELEMPQNLNMASDLKNGLKNGLITEEQIDGAVKSMLRFVYRICEMRNGFDDYNYSRIEQHKTAYKAACETITLLKNNRNILPISNMKYKKIAVLGRCAGEDILYMGGGSSKVSNSKEFTDIPIEYICKNADGIDVDYIPLLKDGFLDQGLVSEVMQMKLDYDCVIVFIGDNYGVDNETECYDRDNLKFPNYINTLLADINEKYNNVVLVLQTGSAVIPYRWEGIPAIVQMWFSGESAGKAIADILFGKVNPSGKLSETFAKCERKDLEYPGDGVKCRYFEGNNVGYRYYDKHPEEIWFSFGHGLSYTKFEYSKLIIDKKYLNTEKFEINVSFDVKNIGDTEGKEIAQLYIAPLGLVVDRPIKELRQFEKINILPGETKTIHFTLDDTDFAYYNICLHEWHIESGKYEIQIGASSRDIRLSEGIDIKYDNDYSVKDRDKSEVTS